MNKYFWIFGFLFSIGAFSQTNEFPKFEECANIASSKMETCFLKQTRTLFFKNFITPTAISKDQFDGTVKIIFTVTSTGKFQLFYMDSPYSELKTEVIRVLANMPIITPAKYNQRTIDMNFSLAIDFPLTGNEGKESFQRRKLKTAIERPNSVTNKQTSNLFQSQLNIPFNHIDYIEYEFALMNLNNAHSAVKPYVYSALNSSVNFDERKVKFTKKSKNSWFGRKLWNEHLLEINEEKYWLTLDLLPDIQLGKDNLGDSFTYHNGRILKINGGFGNKISFSSSIYESQARFADYVNDYVSNRSTTFKPAFSEGLIPGRGKAKGFGSTAFDFPVAEGYISYTPNALLQFQFGNGKNFIGNGYRSLLLSDNPAPMPYLKMDVNFGKFRYSNIWMWGTDVRQPVVVNGAHARKYIALHYLSINLTKKLNIGLFETAISKGEDGFDIGFMNPLMYYRSVEFNRGEEAGNAMIGVTVDYKLKKNLLLYSQLVIDELKLGKVTELGYWGNKFGMQIGAKYFDAFNVKNLFLQGEVNMVRPYTYSHKDPVLNYGNYSQSLGHSWGANFWEFVGIANYTFDRWTTTAKVVLGKKGFDLNDTENYGSNIYKSYTTRVSENGNKIGQGNSTFIFIADVQARYLMNPSTNMKLFGGVSFRKFSPNTTTANFQSTNTIWVSLGVKFDLFNWYLDF